MTYDKESFLKGLMTGLRLGRAAGDRHPVSTVTLFSVNEWVPAAIYQTWDEDASVVEANAAMMLTCMIPDSRPVEYFSAPDSIRYFL